ncbi:MAG: hypothetical protein AAF960_04030 [Bacteroidota bacterium]
MEVNKTRKIIGWVLVAAPLLMLLPASFAKITGNPEAVGNLTQLNILNAPIVGVITLISVVLYLIPKTSNIGFFLLCSYFGGVIVGEFALGLNPLTGIGLSVLLYVGTMLRKPELSGLGI